MDIKSGSWNATNCHLLLVESKTQNIMGSGILLKLGITLTANKNSGKRILHFTESIAETNIIKCTLPKYTQLCTRFGKSKHHIAKPSMKEDFTPVQQKGKRVPSIRKSRK